MYLGHLLHWDLEGRLVVHQEVEQGARELGLAPVPALDTEVHLVELAAEVGEEEVAQLLVVLRRGDQVSVR